MADAFGESSSVALGVHPVDARFPDDLFSYVSCSFRYRRFMVSITPLRGWGAFGVICVDTLTWEVYPVPIPCQLDYSYAVEVYTSWVLYRVKSMMTHPVSLAPLHAV